MSAANPSRGAAASAGRQVFALFVSADLLLIALFVYNANFAPSPEPFMNLSNDDGWAEFYLHLKQVWLVVLLVVLWRIRGDAVLLGWLAVALYYGLDDMLHLHERMGEELVEVGPAIPLVGRHANHVYEVVWLALWGLVIGAAVLVLHRRSGVAARGLSRRLAGLFGLLILVGVVLDAAHVVVEDIRYVNGLFIIAEEGGEHLLMSFLLAMLISCVALDRWPGHEGRWLLPPDAGPTTRAPDRPATHA